MGLRIYLRRRPEGNHFRHVILSAVASGLGNEAILCSGFFQEREDGFRSSREGQFRRVARRLRRLTTVGVYSYGWMEEYRRFCRALANGRVAVRALHMPGCRWHAKVFLLKRRRVPVLGIVGSSNMTRTAFSLDAPFNWEADVVLWSDDDPEVDRVVLSTVLPAQAPTFEVITADYDPVRNGGLTITDRLMKVEKELEERGLKPLAF